MRPAPAFRALGVFAVVLAAPVAARAVVDSQQCRMECGAVLPERTQNTAIVQTCLGRCEVRRAALGNAGPTAATVMPNPATPWTRAPGRAPGLAESRGTARAEQDRRIAAQVAALPPQAAGRRGAPPAVPPVPPAQLAMRAPPPRPGPPPVIASPPAPPQASGSFLGSFMAAQAAEPGPAARASAPVPSEPGGLFGAIYLAAAPSRSYGLTVGMSDRVAAHRGAQMGCIAAPGAPCRPEAEFTARCAAVAHALRSNGGVAVTAHASTYTVVGATTGTGASREAAERAALTACNARARGMQCQITEARCATGA